MALFAPGFLTMAGLSLAGGALGAGGSILASKMSGGGGAEIDSKAIKQSLAAYQAKVGELAAQLKAETAAIAGAAKNEVGGYANDYRNLTQAEAEKFRKELDVLNQSYAESVSSLSNAFPEQVNAALASMQEATNALNAGSRADTLKQLEAFTTAAGQLDANLRGESDASINRFLAERQAATTEYETKSNAQIDAAKAESLSLGDIFMQRANAAMADYTNQSVTPTAQRLAEITSVADTLSKGAQQTRMDLLAKADPRALELSAIADENAAALMSGRISADTQANLARASAFKALQGGVGGSSAMGRNLTARDLGLTSLDLQQRGTAMYDAQRRLNYDTRVAGTQVNPFDVSQQMQAASGNLLSSRLSTAQADTAQRQAAINDASTQKLGTIDAMYGNRMAAADTVRAQEMTLAQNLYNNNLEVNRDVLRTSLANTQDIYNTNWGLQNTAFNARVGTAGQLLSTGLGLASDIYKTNAGAAGSIYGQQSSAEGNIFSGRTTTANNAMAAQAAAAIAAMQAEATAAGGAASGGVSLSLQQMQLDQGNKQAAANMWGSAISGVASSMGFLAGQSWNANPSRAYGGTTYNTQAAAQAAAPYASSYSNIPGMGYVPAATKK